MKTYRYLLLCVDIKPVDGTGLRTITKEATCLRIPNYHSFENNRALNQNTCGLSTVAF